LDCNEAVVGGADPCTTGPWWETGFADPDAYRFWSGKLCGLACLESALDFWEIERPDRAALLDEALEWGAYVRRGDGGVDGLIYAPFLRWIGTRFGIGGQVHGRIGLAELVGIGPGSFAIASVSPEIRWPERPNERRGGHLVLVTGSDSERVWFHNPSGFEEKTAIDAELRIEVMDRFFAGRGMTLTPVRRGRSGCLRGR
jgi:hypothetical protein